MTTQGWNYALRTLLIAALAVSLSGCQTVRPGAAHPFYTLFSHVVPDEVQSERSAGVARPISRDQPVTDQQFSIDMPPWFQSPDTTAALPAQTEADLATQL